VPRPSDSLSDPHLGELFGSLGDALCRYKPPDIPTENSVPGSEELPDKSEDSS
jgi:hypothetical protein